MLLHHQLAVGPRSLLDRVGCGRGRSVDLRNRLQGRKLGGNTRSKNFAFKLPDGCKNQSSLWLRFRVNSDERVDGKAANSATGTNRMIYTSLKKKVN